MTRRPQHLEALDGAVVSRSCLAGARRELVAGALAFEQALDDRRLLKQPIWRIVALLPGVGEVKMRGILNRAGMRTHAGCSFALRTVGELTPLQREALIDEVARCPRRKPASGRRAAHA